MVWGSAELTGAREVYGRYMPPHQLSQLEVSLTRGARTYASKRNAVLARQQLR